MATGYIETTIGEQITLQRGIDITKAQQKDGEIPVVSSGGISSYHDKAFTSGPGVVLGRKGVVGSVFYVPVDYWPHDTTLWVKDFHGNHPRYVYYFFKSLAPTLVSLNFGSANPTLNRNHIHPIKIHWPSFDIQEEVAQILGSLDDKIDLNRQMNQILEAMARAIFQSWFVDFDPVRAKAEGRDPGLPDEIAGLFPDGFEESPLGEIPKGWKVLPLDEIATFLNGLACQKYPASDGEDYYHVIKIAELRRGFTESSDHATKKVPNEYIIHDGDVLFSWSGSLEVCLWTNGEGLLNQHLFKVSSKHYPKWFYYLWTLFYLPEFRAVASDKATTMGHIQRYHLTNSLVVVPPNDTLQIMDDIMSPIIKKYLSNGNETQTLIQLKNDLLPRLMSGELQVAG